MKKVNGDNNLRTYGVSVLKKYIYKKDVISMVRWYPKRHLSLIGIDAPEGWGYR
jgi:hypothetical protein